MATKYSNDVEESEQLAMLSLTVGVCDPCLPHRKTLKAESRLGWRSEQVRVHDKVGEPLQYTSKGGATNLENGVNGLDKRSMPMTSSSSTTALSRVDCEFLMICLRIGTLPTIFERIPYRHVAMFVPRK